jgi:hypothetical protein
MFRSYYQGPVTRHQKQPLTYNQILNCLHTIFIITHRIHCCHIIIQQRRKLCIFQDYSLHNYKNLNVKKNRQQLLTTTFSLCSSV